MSNANWKNNAIQFPRLLAEIMATQELNMEALAESMDLSVEEVDELFDRADQEWEVAKEGNPVGLEAILMDGKIGVTPDPMNGWVAHSFGDATKFNGATPLAAAKSCWVAGQPQTPVFELVFRRHTHDDLVLAIAANNKSVVWDFVVQNGLTDVAALGDDVSQACTDESAVDYRLPEQKELLATFIGIKPIAQSVQKPKPSRGMTP